MSDKLLHELLRDAGGNCSNTVKAVGLDCKSMKKCEECYDMLRKALADEIERQYVPVPRFPDGTRVEMGCKVEGGTVEGWCVWDDGSFDLYNDEGDTIHEGKPGDFAKPPETDSLEKLRDDMKLIADHYPDSISTPGEWVKRLTALMERGDR